MDQPKIVTLQELTGGHSGAAIFKMSFAGQDYCLKFSQHPTMTANLARMQEICDIYRTLDIPAMDLVGYGYARQNQFYLFNYLTGENFQSYSQAHYSLAEIHQAGVEIGRDLSKLKVYPLAQVMHIEHENIAKLTTRGQKLYQTIQNRMQTAGLEQVFLPLWEIFQQGPAIFANVEPRLIHGDIKRSNVIINPAEKKYLIDLGGMKISYDVLNFRYQITWALLAENEQKRAFARGFFDGLYDFTRPQGFREQIIFVTILNFLEHSVKFFNDQQEITWYFAKMLPVFEQLANSRGTII